MKPRILLCLLLSFFILSTNAQKKQKSLTAYAITGVQKGQNNWTEVRLIDINTGEELKTIYQSSQEVERLNARTGKPIVLKGNVTQQAFNTGEGSRVVKSDDGTVTNITTTLNNDKEVLVKKIKVRDLRINSDKPFATNSAACAYDKKHGRLYYTPMGINQLRYIDLKSSTPKVYYFEDEPFGALKNFHDIPNQITRMVIGADGNGYALTNDANHLIQFTTKKHPVITDLGALTDDAANGSFSVHSSKGYGGDMIAATSGEFYLITANHAVYRFDVQTKVAAYMGSINGLPKGYTTNGAITDGTSTIIVNSSNSTLGYYKFDLNNLQAEKISGSSSVFNASDLANEALVTVKKHKDVKPVAEQPVVAPPNTVESQSAKRVPQEVWGAGSISVYPNPVINGLVRLSFANQPQGRYQIQLLDIDGKLISSQPVTINNKTQVEEFRISKLIAGGDYLIKVLGENNSVAFTQKIIVQ
jgi:hypothetical protein